MTMTAEQWVAHWQRVGPILERINAKELRTMDARETIRKILPMCDWCFENSETRTTTGLVEQQRYFAKMRTDEK